MAIIYLRAHVGCARSVQETPTVVKDNAQQIDFDVVKAFKQHLRHVVTEIWCASKYLSYVHAVDDDFGRTGAKLGQLTKVACRARLMVNV